MIVTAPRLPPGAGAAAFSAVRLRPEETGAVRLDEAIGRVPGASLFRRNSSLAANPTTQGLSLRGVAPSGAGRALVTLDGVPQNDPFGGWVIWSQLPPESIGALEIVRGAGAGPYGAGALTGVVSLEERDEGAAADIFAAERGGARAAATATARPLFLAGAYERSDGYHPVRGIRAGAAEAPTDLEAAALTARYTAAIGPVALAARANAYAEDRGSGLVGPRSRAEGASASLTAVRTGPLGWRLQAWARHSDLFNTSVATAPDRGGTTPASSQDETPAAGRGLNAALRTRRAGLDLEAGLDARWAEGETRERFRFLGGQFTRTRVAGGQASVAGAYAEATRLSGPWLLTGGARLDRWTTTDGVRIERDIQTGALTLNDRPPDRDGVVPTGRLGVRRRLAPDLHLRAAAYAGFRPPTLNELHRPFRVGNDLTEANPALEPERLQGADLGLDGGDGAFRWSLGAWANRLEDAVTNVTIAQGPGTFPRAGFVPAGGVLRERRNAGTVNAHGLEAEAERRWTDRLALRAALAVTDARVDGGSQAPQLTGRRPAQAPIWSATAGLRAQPLAPLSLRLDARWESARWEDDANTRRLGAALTLDAGAELTLRPGAALYLAADNLLDADVETGRTADDTAQLGPPRTLRVGLRLSR